MVNTRSLSPPGRRVPRSSVPYRFATPQSSGLESVKWVRTQDERACQANSADDVRSTVVATYPLSDRVYAPVSLMPILKG